MNEEFKEISTGVATGTEDGQVKMSVIIDNKMHSFVMEPHIAVTLIKALANALDELLHAM
jgi:hypothetical protein